MTRLRVGEVYLFNAGPAEDVPTPHRVSRVSECSATLVAQYAEPKIVELPDGRTFEVRSGGRSIQVSPYAVMGRVS